MVSLQRVDVTMFRDVYPLLLEHDPSLTEVEWRSIFNYAWEKEEQYCGYGLFDGKEIVGFLGLIFSKRHINNEVEYFCNLTSWMVKEHYRDHSLSLIVPVLRLKNCTITDLSPSDTVIRILQRFGFKELDSRVKILFPIGIFKKNNVIDDCLITQDKIQIKKILKEQDTKLLLDHYRYHHVHHLLAYSDNRHCYLIFTIVKNRRVPYCYILYINNIELFSIYSYKIRSEISKIGRTPLVLVDSRLVKDITLPFSYNLPLRFPKLYRSSSLRPEQIDNLYSELPLLNVSIMPRTLRDLWQDFQFIRPKPEHTSKVD
jgi:hypothetical protein